MRKVVDHRRVLLLLTEGYGRCFVADHFKSACFCLVYWASFLDWYLEIASLLFENASEHQSLSKCFHIVVALLLAASILLSCCSRRSVGKSPAISDTLLRLRRLLSITQC